MSLDQVVRVYTRARVKHVKLYPGIAVDIEPNELLYTTPSGVYSTKRGCISGCVVENLEKFVPRTTVFDSGVLIESGWIEDGPAQVFAQRARIAASGRDVAYAVEKAEVAVIRWRSRVAVKTPLGWIVEDGAWRPRGVELVEVVFGGRRLFVERGYLERYRRLADHNDVYGSIARLVQSHPAVLVELARNFNYIPPPPDPVVMEPDVFSTKGATDELTLSTYVNTAVFDLLLLAAAASGDTPASVAEEYVRTVLHEVVHAGRDATGLGGRGAWLLGVPFGDEAETESLAKRLSKLVVRDRGVWSAVVDMFRRRMESIVEANSDVVHELSDYLNKLGEGSWIHTGDVSVLERDYDVLKVEIAVVTDRLDRAVQLAKSYKNVEVAGRGSDRVYIATTIVVPAISEYPSHTMEEL